MKCNFILSKKVLLLVVLNLFCVIFCTECEFCNWCCCCGGNEENKYINEHINIIKKLGNAAKDKLQGKLFFCCTYSPQKGNVKGRKVTLVSNRSYGEKTKGFFIKNKKFNPINAFGEAYVVQNKALFNNKVPEEVKESDEWKKLKNVGINEFEVTYKVPKECKKGNNNNEGVKIKLMNENFYKNNNKNITIKKEKGENEEEEVKVNEYTLEKGQFYTFTIKIKEGVTSLEGMFNGCKYLTKISGTPSKNTTSFEKMFEGCSALTDVSGLEYICTAKQTSFSGMFSRCTSLINIDGLENWKVSNGENFSCMFYGCSSLQNVNGLEKWNVSNGKNFSFMFYGCSKLKKHEIPQNLKDKGVRFF